MVKNSQPKIVTMTPSFATVQIIKKLVGGIISVRTVISMVSITGKIEIKMKSNELFNVILVVENTAAITTMEYTGLTGKEVHIRSNMSQ